MTDRNKEILGIIPARGGSKSIPLKNIVSLNDRPLISYVISAGGKCSAIDRLLCSTDDEKIADICKGYGVEVMKRPDELSGDLVPVIDVLTDILNRLKKEEAYMPFAVALLQPTSPFVLPEHIDRCVELLRGDPSAGSVQTIAKLPHNHHAFNQRELSSGAVSFRFPKEREACYNKQKKPEFYAFGNLVVTRTSSLLEGKGVFAVPSLGSEIDPYYALDLDGPGDLELAEWYIRERKVKLPEIE